MAANGESSSSSKLTDLVTDLAVQLEKACDPAKMVRVRVRVCALVSTSSSERPLKPNAILQVNVDRLKTFSDFDRIDELGSSS